ncbi:hypothetical protein GALL_101980 [mine drainage metagenome]|uniref:DUF5675 domain-containing protein n=1 Tax=mine drainage metagenome TaxID=410659 RepID=A0A1J5SGG7_9ZZZZ
MELELIRTYYPNGTNGTLYYNNDCLCNTIELPWKNNQHQISCIPEGSYELMKRWSDHFGWHLQVMKVKNRDLILIHPANDALKELKGCIAPVSVLIGEGEGLRSRIALEKIKTLVYPELDDGKAVYLKIINGKKAALYHQAESHTNT